tara:strand:+ start:603 stop:1139 length:537 start_codon:yes stop_codon:yes gene_type:complete
MDTDYFKALHIIFVTTWFAGLFYIVRLFIYHREASDKPVQEKKILIDQFKIMEKRLWYGITWPSCVLTILFGFSMIHDYLPITDYPWLVAKLIFVFLLFLYHLSCGKILKDFHQNIFNYSSMQLRIWNEVATIFLVSIIFLVVLKDLLSMTYGLIGLFILTFSLMIGIKIYRKKRQQR